MAGELLRALIGANLAASVAIIVVLGLRWPTRTMLGAGAAYRLWIVPILATLASVLPGQTRATFSAVMVPARVISQQTMARVETLVPATRLPTGGVSLTSLILIAWAVGVVLSMSVILMRQRRTVARLGRLSRARDEDFWRSETPAMGPALIGVARPRLVVPADFDDRYDEAERRLVLSHEEVHRAAGHTWINGLAALIQCLNWFNPLVHLAVHHARLDQELACDAAVVARFPGERRTYAEALLKTQLAPGYLPLGCTWPSRSRNRLKERILMLASKTPGRARKLAALFFLTTLGSVAGLAAWAAQPDHAHGRAAGLDVMVEPLAVIPQAEIDHDQAMTMAEAARQGLEYDRWDEFSYTRYLPAYHSNVPKGWEVELHSKVTPLVDGIPSEDTWKVREGEGLTVERDERSSKRYTFLSTVRVEPDQSLVLNTVFVIHGQPAMAKDVRIRSGETANIHLLTGEVLAITPVLRRTGRMT